MKGSWLAASVLSVAVLSLAGQGASAQQTEPSAREKQLEELVRKLSERVDKLEKRLSQVETPEVERSTERRVQQLEQSVEKIEEERPPAADSEEWAKMRKWVSDSSTLRPYWKDGLRLDSADGSVKLKIGGNIQNDYAYFEEDKEVGTASGRDFDDDVEFRRARLYFSGTIYHDVEFKAQYDFADGDADFKDVYLGLRKVPYVGNIRFGQFKEPFSFEELISSNSTTLMERSLVNTFAPSRNVGIMLHDSMLDQRMTWAAGLFRQSDDFGEGTGGRNYNVTARLTGLPVYEEQGKRLLHFGVACTHQNYEDDEIRFRARPESHLAPRVVDTGSIPAEHGDLVGAELAWVHGPLSLQAEYVHAFMQGDSHRIGDPKFWGAYVQAGYFLTGEHRPYKTSNGTFSGVKPLENCGKDGGPGAWELAARYSHLNLSDAGVRGGRLRDFTLGLNWYLNPNLRMMWNYILADPSDGGDVNIFQWRLQITF